MKVFLLAAMLLLAPIPTPTWTAATEQVLFVNQVQRSVATRLGEVSFVFSTVYQVAGRQVRSQDFWRQIRPRQTLQLKLEAIRGVWVVRRVNLLVRP